MGLDTSGVIDLVSTVYERREQRIDYRMIKQTGGEQHHSHVGRHNSKPRFFFGGDWFPYHCGGLVCTMSKSGEDTEPQQQLPCATMCLSQKHRNKPAD